MKKIVVLAGVLCSIVAADSSAAEWHFDVSLDGKPIGYHRFELRDDGAQHELVSEARFNVKVLFVTAYRYAHDDRELWSNGCLKRLDARTDDNGTRRHVQGNHESERFVVKTDHRIDTLESCVMTFAYWNPSILEATQLLNPQTGEYVPVRISRLDTETLTIGNRPQTSERFHLVADAAIGGKLQIDLWYSPNKEWLALESLTADGHRLRYRRDSLAVEGERHASAR